MTVYLEYNIYKFFWIAAEKLMNCRVAQLPEK